MLIEWMIFALAPAEEIGIGAKIWRQLRRIQPPVSAVVFTDTIATLTPRCKETIAILRANGL
jgi:hypothetical protein